MKLFESGVNPEGIQTLSVSIFSPYSFESGVNPEGIQTFHFLQWMPMQFESGVNPEGIQTGGSFRLRLSRLRVV